MSRAAQAAIRDQGFGSPLAAESAQRASDLERAAHAITYVRAALATIVSPIDKNTDKDRDTDREEEGSAPHNPNPHPASLAVQKAAESLRERTGTLERQLLATVRCWLQEGLEEPLGETEGKDGDGSAVGEDRAVQVCERT